jgi:hypothetical protein
LLIEKTFHQYVVENLTGDEDEGNDEECLAHRPVGNTKPKLELATGSKGQPLLPKNCVSAHGDKARFLDFQKGIERAHNDEEWTQEVLLLGLQK